MKDGGGAAARGGGVGWRLKIAVAVLGSSGGKRTCNDGVGISLVKAEGLLYDVRVSIGEDGKRRHIQCKGRTLSAMARRKAYCSSGGSGSGADTTIASTRQG